MISTVVEEFRAWAGDDLAGYAEVIRKPGGWWSVALHADARPLPGLAGYRMRDLDRPHGFRRAVIARQYAAEFAAELVIAARTRENLEHDAEVRIGRDTGVYTSSTDVHPLIPHVQHVVGGRVCDCATH
jgi:hypothetical protein